MFASGCALLRPDAAPPPAAPMIPLPAGDVAVERLLERARLDSAGRIGLRATARVHLSTNARSGSVREVIVAARPAHLRLETLNMLGHTQALLVTDGEYFVFFDGKRTERGAVTPTVLRSHLGLDLAPREAVAALLAAPTLPSAPPTAAFRQAGDTLVTLGGQQLRFDPAGELRGLAVLDPLGGLRWTAEYDGWGDTPGGRHPFEMRLAFPSTELFARLELKDVELNPELDPALFRVPVANTRKGAR
jgi:hypothetical protein